MDEKNGELHATRITRAAAGLAVSICACVLGGKALAQSASGNAVDSAVLDEVVVTGTRIRSAADGSRAPTPVTVVSTESLQATTPSNLPDALNKLPVFQGSQQPRRAGDGSSNLASNVLNLRNFGSQRTLVLLDGHRLTPTESNGTVSADTLPEMLVSRVDVVTAGASAVYGSDAVTGVVNFILDKSFSGLKFNLNYGESTYWDGSDFRLGAAFGHSLFGGRGHILASAEHFHQDPIATFDRPYGPGVNVLTGSGTATSPFIVTGNTRRADSAFGGRVNSCAAPCPALGEQFVANGVLGPFDPGSKSGTANQNSGGDGAYSPYTTALAGVRTDQGFLRFSYDITDGINFYAQGSAAETYSYGWHFPAKLTPVGATTAPTTANSTASVFFKNNPLLPPEVQTQLGNNGLSNSSNTFSLGTYITDLGAGGTTGTRNFNRNYNITSGLNGVLGRFHWDLFYTHGQNRQHVFNLNNSNYQRQFAALDAVTAPDGTIRCYAATQAATAAQYAGCVPLNAFGPTAITRQAFDWFTQTTLYRMNDTMDNAGGSFSGSAFDDWAGPIEFALSTDVRHLQYEVTSNADPTAHVDCTGLRICNPNLALWAQPVSGQVQATNDVKEVAAELEVPLLADVPFARSVVANLAGRHTHYRISGNAQTWKVGLVWDVNGTVRFRGTTSVDIRAPTLNDLFQPVQASVTGFVDLHTSTSNTVFLVTKGNPNLVPEKARTQTFGVVFEPRFIPGLTASADVYQIRLDNVIGSVSAGNNSVQKLCEDSGGASQYCSLFLRPFPFADHSAANFPTNIYSLNLNTAMAEIRGVDFEASYSKDRFSARLFSTYQPTNNSQAFPGAAIVHLVPPQGATAPKTRVTGVFSYDIADWTVGLQDNWMSGYSQVTQDGQVWARPHVRPFNSMDLNLQWKWQALGADLSAYFTVQNLFNSKPDLVPAGGSVGLFYPVPNGEDIMGRYLTLGIRGKL